MRSRFEANGHRNGHDEPRERIAALTSVRPIDAFDGERWYPVIDEEREETRGQIFNCLSVTTANSAYPKGRWFEDWLKKQGQNADTIRDDAAFVGVQVDRGTQLLDKGITLHCDDYRTEVYKALLSYPTWREDFSPEILAQQKTVWCLDDLIAGTFDKIAEIQGELHMVEVKKTSGIRRTHIIQSQVYAHLCNLMGIPVRYADVLRLGTKHKRGYEFHSELYDPLVYHGPFMACVELWKDSHDGRFEPIPREPLPASISIPVPQNGHAEPPPASGRTTWKPRTRR